MLHLVFRCPFPLYMWYRYELYLFCSIVVVCERFVVPPWSLYFLTSFCGVASIGIVIPSPFFRGVPVFHPFLILFHAIACRDAGFPYFLVIFCFQYCCHFSRCVAFGRFHYMYYGIENINPRNCPSRLSSFRRFGARCNDVSQPPHCEQI